MFNSYKWWTHWYCWKSWYYNAYVNLTECNDNDSSTSGGLWQFKRDESRKINDGNPGKVTTDNSSSFKYIPSVLEKPENDGVLKKMQK